MRSKRMNTSQAILSNDLFILNATLRTSLLEIRQICNEILKLRLHKIETQTYSLNEFIYAQNEHKTVVQNQLNEYFTQLRNVVLSACEDSLQAHGFLSDRDYNSDEDSLPSSPLPSKHFCFRS